MLQKVAFQVDRVVQQHKRSSLFRTSCSTQPPASMKALLDWILHDPRDQQLDARLRQQLRLVPPRHTTRLIRTHQEAIIAAFQRAPYPVNAAPHILLEACFVGSLPLVELLLPICGTNFMDLNRETPLMRAAAGGRIEIVAFLLVQAAPHPIGDAYTALLDCAVRGGSVEVVELLLKLAEEDFDVNETVRPGETLLRTAIANDRVAVAAMLVAHGASLLHDPNAIRSLHSVEMVRMLYDNGVSFCGSAGRDAIINAVRSDEWSLITFLLEHGADKRQNQSTDKSCLHEASVLGKSTAVQLFVAHGVDIDARLPGGRTPLHQAACSGHDKVVRILLSAGADPDARDDEGNSPMFLASQSVKVREVLRDASRLSHLPQK